MCFKFSKTYYLCCLLLAVCIFTQAQTHRNYTLKAAGLKIGKLEAYHIKNGAFDYYVTHSVVDFITVKADVKTESFYYNGMLTKAIVSSKINGESYSSKTFWKKDHYDIDCHTRKYSFKDTTLTKPIKWSTGKMYFEIPTEGTEVYAESYGKTGTLVETKKYSLKMATPESKQIFYYDPEYSKILKIEILNSIKNFEMIPDN